MGSKSAGFGAAKPLKMTEPDKGTGAPGAIDREYLARFTLGNEALEQEVLQLFAGQAPLYLQQLKSAKTAKEWSEAAHTIKGSAAAIGARHLTAVAEVAERLRFERASFEDDEARARAIDTVAMALDDVCRCIERIVAGN